jgi:type VI secretion system protein ImpK
MPLERQLDNLALAFQEPLTAIERVRAGREKVDDAEIFRAGMLQQLIKANEEGRKRGYSNEDVRVAMFAAVALLDESILSSRNAAFADWARRPLQQEIFGGHEAGEIFFQNIETLLTKPDSGVLADILEMYLLCILLGYGGKYSVRGKGELRAIADSLFEKVRRIRGDSGPLSWDWAPQGGVPAAQADPWVRRLTMAAAACVAVAVVLFAIFKISLSSGVTGLQ